MDDCQPPPETIEAHEVMVAEHAAWFKHRADMLETERQRLVAELSVERNTSANLRLEIDGLRRELNLMNSRGFGR